MYYSLEAAAAHVHLLLLSDTYKNLNLVKWLSAAAKRTRTMWSNLAINTAIISELRAGFISSSSSTAAQAAPLLLLPVLSLPLMCWHSHRATLQQLGQGAGVGKYNPAWQKRKTQPRLTVLANEGEKGFTDSLPDQPSCRWDNTYRVKGISTHHFNSLLQKVWKSQGQTFQFHAPARRQL